MRLGAKARSDANFAKVLAASAKAQFQNLRHGAFSIAKLAKSLIVRSKEPGKEGDAPTTRGQGGHNLRGAIWVDAQPDSAIAGPRHSFVGDVGAVHEFGETRGEDQFDERPFMSTALEASVDRFGRSWHGSIGD